jgi:hypothetical protein
MAHKKFEKFFVVNTTDGNLAINREDRVFDIKNIIDTVADYPASALSLAEATCRLLNSAYSEGHARGVNCVFEGIRDSIGVDE